MTKRVPPPVLDEQGMEAVVLELYESESPNQNLAGPVWSSYYHAPPHVKSKAYTLPFSVRGLGVTKTLGGISTRQVLFALESNLLTGVSRRLLDAKRVAVLNADEREQGSARVEG